MIWLLGYFLIGFMISWLGTHVGGIARKLSWQWELVFTILWPIPLLLGIFSDLEKRESQDD